MNSIIDDMRINGAYSSLERTIEIRKKGIRKDLKSRNDPRIREDIRDQIKMIRKEREIIEKRLIK